MIIDADVHISPFVERGLSAKIDETIERMDYAKVDKSLIWLIPPYMREIDESNAYVHKAASEYPDRFIPFGWADPNLGVQKAKDMAKKCIEEYGMYGVKLNGAQNSFYIDDPKLSLPVIEEIAKRGKVLAFHIGADAFEQTHPFRLAKIAKMYPEINILASHMGGASFKDMSNAMIEVAEQCPNIHLIGSAIKTYPILKAIKVLGSERVSFGSDTPFELMHVSVAKYNAMLSNTVDEEGYKNIMGDNIVRILDL